MKKAKVICISVICATFGLHGQELPDGREGKLEDRMKEYAASTGGTDDFGDHYLPLSPDWVLGFAKANDIPFATVVSMAKTWLRNSADVSGGKKTREEAPYPVGMIPSQLLWLIAMAGDKGQLPFLEEMSDVKDYTVRLEATVAYLHLAGANSVDFLRRATANEWYANINWDTVYRYFFNSLIKWKWDEAGEAEKAEVWAFFLETIQSDERDTIVMSMDSFLCNSLSDYMAICLTPVNKNDVIRA